MGTAVLGVAPWLKSMSAVCPTCMATSPRLEVIFVSGGHWHFLQGTQGGWAAHCGSCPPSTPAPCTALTQLCSMSSVSKRGSSVQYGAWRKHLRAWALDRLGCRGWYRHALAGGSLSCYSPIPGEISTYPWKNHDRGRAAPCENNFRWTGMFCVDAGLWCQSSAVVPALQRCWVVGPDQLTHCPAGTGPACGEAALLMQLPDCVWKVKLWVLWWQRQDVFTIISELIQSQG